MPVTETAAEVSITVNGTSVKLTTADAWAFARRITQALDCVVVEGMNEACVVLATLPDGSVTVQGPSPQAQVAK